MQFPILRKIKRQTKPLKTRISSGGGFNHDYFSEARPSQRILSININPIEIIAGLIDGARMPHYWLITQ